MTTAPAPTPSDTPSRPRWSWPLLGSILLVAAALRIWRLGHGLPDFLEEAIPLRRALEMGGWQTGLPDLDPAFFNYPSLVIYLQLLLVRVQVALGLATGRLAEPADFWVLTRVDPTGPVVVARLVGVAADLVTVFLVWRLAARLRPGAPAAPAVAATLVAACAVMIRTSRLIYVDPVLAVLVVAATDRLVAWQQAGGRGRLAAAIVLVGLAAGAKYQGGFLILPLGWALWARAGRRGLAWWPAAAAGSLAVFLLTSPYVVLDFPAFWSALSFERTHMATGHLGTRDTAGAGYAAGVLWRDLGPAGLLLALAGLVLPWRRWRDAPAVTLALAWLPLAVSVAVARMAAERYLVPLVPLLAVAAAVALADLLGRWRRGRDPHPWWPTALALAVVLGPVLWHGAVAAYRGRDHTQQQARRWLEANVAAAREVVLRESYTVQLPTAGADRRVADHAAWALASPAARRAYLAGPRYHAVTIPLLVSGDVSVTLTDRRSGRPATVEVFAHSADANAIFYEPALLQDVDLVVVSSAVGDRLGAHPSRYPRQLALYRLLARETDTAAVFAPHGAVVGPTVTVYRLGARFRRALAAHLPLEPFWWTETVPASYKRAFRAAAVPEDRRCGPGPLCPDGRLAPWVVGLQRPFRDLVAPFLGQLATAHDRTGHAAAARQAAAPLVVMDPADGAAAALFARASLDLGDPDSAVAVLRRAIASRRDAQLDTDRLEALLAEAVAAADGP